MPFECGRWCRDKVLQGCADRAPKVVRALTVTVPYLPKQTLPRECAIFSHCGHLSAVKIIQLCFPVSLLFHFCSKVICFLSVFRSQSVRQVIVIPGILERLRKENSKVNEFFSPVRWVAIAKTEDVVCQV